MMAGSFRRAHLRGSDELFRPTRPGEDAGAVSAAPLTRAPSAAPPTLPAHAAPGLGVERPEGRLLRLSDEEIEILVDAVQRMRYPTQSKPAQKPPIDVFERLGELRAKLLEGDR